jgi:L-threonylcarbamoyladenylate synthase
VSQFLSNCTADAIASAAKQLMAGDLVAFPTETVYGLGADASNSAAVARIYSVKGRPNNHPLIVHIASMDRMGDWASDVPEYAIALARNFWPGPMTLVLKRSGLAGDFVTGGQDTVGVRVPNHLVALRLLESFEALGGKGIAAPSANRFGQVSPTNAEAVVQELGNYLSPQDLVLDGGSCSVGIESTIIDCTSEFPKILRPGAISTTMINISTGLSIYYSDLSPLGLSASAKTNSAPPIRVSGLLENHYAPKAKVILDQIPKVGHGFLALSNLETPPEVIRLASPKSNEEFAQLLYSAFRLADNLGISEIVVIQPLGNGIAIAIRDRLRRASQTNI